ncbi:MAG: YhcH/YjgK/YiaL family protein [Clostridia bacterium]
MILDQCENALSYLGMNPELDIALRFLKQLKPAQLAVDTRAELSGKDVFYFVNEPTLTPKELNFEFHRRYMDIHVPLSGTEEIAICAAAQQPGDTAFDAEKDIGFFHGEPASMVSVKSGWFCLCFPHDAHVPCMAKQEHSIVKMVMKVKA